MPRSTPLGPTEQAAPQTSPTPQSANAPFRFPFAADTYAPKKDAKTAWPGNDKNSNHDQRPGPAPRGSRRSMGKR